jgi:hypothetical protein
MSNDVQFKPKMFSKATKVSSEALLTEMFYLLEHNAI